MTRKKFGNIAKLLLPIFLLSSCGGDGNKYPSYPGWKPGDGTYTVSFVSEGSVVKTYENLKYGDYVDIPAVTHSDTRYSLKGWDGIDKNSLSSGKIMVYESDATYNALWSESFGTNNVFNATQRNVNTEIVIDGNKDIAYNDATAIDVNVVTMSETTTTAKAYAMWDDVNLYVLVEVTDTTYNPYTSGEINDFDAVNMYIDLLHDDSLVPNYTTGWGGAYRGEPGPMCEGWFKIGAGVSYPNNGNRYGAGSEFMFDGWLSNAAKETGNTVGTTTKTSNGYNVEYKIDCTNTNIPSNLRLHEGQEIGIGINVYDKSDLGSSVVSLEEINYFMSETPKKLSNFKLIKNPNQDKSIFTAIHMRESYEIDINKNEYNRLFNDAATINLNNNASVKTLWDEDGLYLYVSMGDANEIKLSSPFLPSDLTVTEDSLHFIAATLESGDTPWLDISVDGETIEGVYALIENSNNVTPTRRVMEAAFKEDTEEIIIDGALDSAYNDAQSIDVSTKSLIEDDNLGVTADAYIKWDNEYIYIFVDVTDGTVDSTTSNPNSPEKNDSVEIWISTCQTIPTLSTQWGYPAGGINSMRPSEDYCGEGKIARRAGSPTGHTVGGHWMWDNAQVVKETASVVTSYGYTTEFKIGWGTFATAVTNKHNEMINLSININDGENNVRKGIVSTNEKCHEIYHAPGYLDILKLV